MEHLPCSLTRRLVGWLRREAPVHEPLAVQGPGDVPADPVREPDLTTLYYEISTALEDPFLCPSPEGLADEQIRSRCPRTCGDARPRAAQLHGNASAVATSNRGKA